MTYIERKVIDATDFLSGISVLSGSISPGAITSGGLASGTIGIGVTGNIIGFNSITSGMVASGGIGPSEIGAVSITSGMTASGGLGIGPTNPFVVGTMATTQISGVGSASGLLASGGGIIASGAFTPRVTGKVMITWNAAVQGTSGQGLEAWLQGPYTTSGANSSSGIGNPAVEQVTLGIGSQWLQAGGTVFQSGLTIGSAQNYAVAISIVAGSGLISGAGFFTATEVLN